MSGSDDFLRTVAQAIGALQSEIATLKKSMDALATKVDTLTAAQNKGAGFLAGVAAVSSLIGAGISFFMDHFWRH